MCGWVCGWVSGCIHFQNRQVRVGRTFSLYVGSCVGGCLPFVNLFISRFTQIPQLGGH